MEIKQIPREVNHASHFLAGLMDFSIGLTMFHAAPPLVADQIRLDRQSLMLSLDGTNVL